MHPRTDVSTAPMPSASARVAGIDILRGAVMVLMAIDHVRVYSGVPAGGPTAGVFFTRWVTHFCAPVFVFLAGTAAFLQLQKLSVVERGLKPARYEGAARGTLARYLVVRGLMLVLLEMTVIRFSWTFNVDYASFTLAGVIWMLGWCMVLMAGLIWLPTWAVGIVGALLILGQSAFEAVARAVQSLEGLWQFLYTGGMVTLGAHGPAISVLYTIVPWIGVMAVGFAFGAVVVQEPAARRRTVLGLGLAATVLFLVVGSLVVFTRTSDDPTPKVFQLLNQRKYPASPLFLLMTLGPSLALLPLADRASRWVRSVLETFGRVPLFYYLLHIPLIHATALLVWFLRDGVVNARRFSTAPYVSIPEPDRWSLPLLYLVWAAVIAMLYFPCRAYAGFKARNPRSLARYI
ncbi:MAG TPA: heparan-alpha-glucosaminide N-acetyltransferase domain-containing protein [Vicinamibacterales bacterium]